MRAEVWILRGKTGGAVGGLRAEGCEVGCRSVSGQTGGKAVRRVQCGANGQVLFICHDGQSITHQAVGHTSICLLSDSTADKQEVQTVYGVHTMIMILPERFNDVQMTCAQSEPTH